MYIESYKNLIVWQKAMELVKKTYKIMEKLPKLTVMIKKLKDKKQLNAKRLTLNAKNGFTMIELLVAMSLFVIVISLVSGVFVRALRSQRQIVGLIAANSNAALALEQMMREMRTLKLTDSNGNPSPPEVSDSGEEISFINAKDEPVTYKLDTDEKGIGFLSRNNERLTAENVSVRKLNFILSATSPFPPRITIAVQLSPTNIGLENSFINLQTTVSARTF
jgi:prepilin-type N-terminal cleavage/methylation domain-containing protein